MSFVGNNPFIAAIIPLAVLSVAIAAFMGEHGAVDYLSRGPASLQADLSRPLDYRDLDTSQILALVLLASAAAVLPARRFYELLKDTFAGPADKI